MILKPKKQPVLTPEGLIAAKVEYESASSLGKAKDCLVVYQQYYDAKMREPSSSSLVFGRAWHDTAEDVMVEKYHHGYVLNTERVHQIFEWRWDMEYKDARESGLVWSGRLSPEQLRQKGFALLDVWLADFAATLIPADIPEVPFWIELEGTSRALYGRIDFPARDNGGGLVDYKTTMHAWTKDTAVSASHARTKFQMALYHLGWYQIYKTWPAWAELHRPITTGTPRIERIPVLITVEEAQRVIREEVRPLVKRIEEAWKTNVWTCTCGKHEAPAVPHSEAESIGRGIVGRPTP